MRVRKDDLDCLHLIRISFDGFGCCDNLFEETTPLNKTDSAILLNFGKQIIGSNWNAGSGHENAKADIAEHEGPFEIVKRWLSLNSAVIWKDALEDFELLIAI